MHAANNREVASKNEGSEPLSKRPHGSSSSVKNTTNEAVTDANDSKQTKESYVSEAINEAAILPKGTLDPVYEAKARVLNHAVGLAKHNSIISQELTGFRFKR